MNESEFQLEMHTTSLFFLKLGADDSYRYFLNQMKPILS